MRILWSDFASQCLSAIYQYHKSVANEKIARRIKSNIFSATKLLTRNPHAGQIEHSLTNLGEGHRYLIESNYKIIYKEVEEGILVTDVFDTRQDPSGINDPKRK